MSELITVTKMSADVGVDTTPREALHLNGTTGLIFRDNDVVLRRYERVRIYIDDNRTYDHLLDVTTKAATVGLLIPPDRFEYRTHLFAWFDYMDAYGDGRYVFVLVRDWAPLSFTFNTLSQKGGGFHGGLIYHGKGTQGMDVGSILVTPAETDGWSMHT